MNPVSSEFECHLLPGNYQFLVDQVPEGLRLDEAQFEALWNMHPAEFHEIRMGGRLVKTPRWQQAYGVDYHYTGRINKAMVIPANLDRLIRWSREKIDERLNGILLNWYDGNLGHYIGRHRDSVHNMAVGAPIVTISFGETRTFRLRPWPSNSGSKSIDFRTGDGRVFVMPWDTNRNFTHEVPASTRLSGRRISVTLRAFVVEYPIGVCPPTP